MPLLLCNFAGEVDESVVVSLVHVGESRSRREVLAVERMLGEEVDVVADNHQIADVECRIHASRGVADEECLDAELIHHADRERHLLHRVALVVVEAAVHGEDVLATEFAEYEFSGMTLNGRHREVGDILICELSRLSDF